MQNIVLYENEEVSSSEAVTHGINSDKIVKVEFQKGWNNL